ncbi:MAG: hypothetical protein Rhirs2KO_09760 [Rhizobiaceae bacterium]
MRPLVALALSGAAMIGVAVVSCQREAVAHGWFSGATDPVTGHGCCDGVDCADVSPEALERVDGGWVWLPTGEFIPDERVQPSQSWSPARCEYLADLTIRGQLFPKGSTRCLFIPMGF